MAKAASRAHQEQVLRHYHYVLTYYVDFMAATLFKPIPHVSVDPQIPTLLNFTSKEKFTRKLNI